jgi:2-phosphosulfolactate phosphatase
MKVEVTGPEGLERLSGAVVVIDVLRAFTTAAYAFASGARDIVLVATVPEAIGLRERFPSARLIGEVGGYPIDGFDFGNSPFELAEQRLDGSRLVQRTTSGTRAAVGARSAQVLLAGSFVVAEATVRHLQQIAPSQVALVLSGRDRPGGGTDDRACADYLAERLAGHRPDPAPFLRRLRDSRGARRFLDPDKVAFRLEDLELALAIDRFDFAMAARWRDGLLVLEPVSGASQSVPSAPYGLQLA